MKVDKNLSTWRKKHLTFNKQNLSFSLVTRVRLKLTVFFLPVFERFYYEIQVFFIRSVVCRCVCITMIHYNNWLIFLASVINVSKIVINDLKINAFFQTILCVCVCVCVCVRVFFRCWISIPPHTMAQAVCCSPLDVQQ